LLRSLATAPYKLLEQSDFKFLSHKTAFLLAIYSAKRMSELHALSVSSEYLRWRAEYAGVSLWPNPFFLPKVVSPQTVNQAIEMETFQPDPSCQEGAALHKLCPYWQAHTQLFVCYGGKKFGYPLSKQRLSHWLVETISQAYSNQDFPVPEGLVAHSTCSSTSWAALKGVAVGDICAACTFAMFYSQCDVYGNWLHSSYDDRRACW